jgi:hypothetical protein
MEPLIIWAALFILYQPYIASLKNAFFIFRKAEALFLRADKPIKQ